MKLHIISDLHAEFWEGVPPFKYHETGSDVIILAGDIHMGSRCIEFIGENFPEDRPKIFVPGNHEFYGHRIGELEKSLIERARRVPGLYVLNNDLVEINGVVFVGSTLWTDLSLTGHPDIMSVVVKRYLMDFRKIMEDSGETLKPSTFIKMHRESVAYLEKALNEAKGKKVVVITHHAPSIRSIDEAYLSGGYEQRYISSAFASDLEDFICRHENITLWIHGHTHSVNDYTICNTRIVSNQLGYAFSPVKDFRPDFTLEV